MLGASAALAVSGIPFRGPIGACRVGYIDDKFVVNPTTEQLKTSRLDLVVAGTQRAVLMVESEADILPEKTMLDAVVFGHREMQVAINADQRTRCQGRQPAWDCARPEERGAHCPHRRNRRQGSPRSLCHPLQAAAH